MKNYYIIMIFELLILITANCFGMDFTFIELTSKKETQFTGYYGESPVVTNENVYFGFGNSSYDVELYVGSFKERFITNTEITGKPFSVYNNNLFLSFSEYSSEKRYFYIYETENLKEPKKKGEFPLFPTNVHYYQNDILYGSTATVGYESMDYEVVTFNISTGELKVLPRELGQYEGIVAISPDKLLIDVGGGHITRADTLEPVTLVKGRGAGGTHSEYGSQLDFLTNDLLIGNTDEGIRVHDPRRKSVVNLADDFREEFNFYLNRPDGSKEQITYIHFTPDLRHAFARIDIQENRRILRLVALLDTTSFRDYLDSKNLLFRPTTAVSTESRVRIRENPNLEAQTFGHLEPGDELEVTDRSGVKVKIGEMTDWWYKIKRKSDGLEGWAYGAFLKLASYQGELGPSPEKDLR